LLPHVPNAATDRERNVRREVEARDAASSSTSATAAALDFDVARAMVDNGFLPDVVERRTCRASAARPSTCW
jgi:predicted amidohydrolase